MYFYKNKYFKNELLLLFIKEACCILEQIENDSHFLKKMLLLVINHGSLSKIQNQNAKTRNGIHKT